MFVDDFAGWIMTAIEPIAFRVRLGKIPPGMKEFDWNPQMTAQWMKQAD